MIEYGLTVENIMDTLPDVLRQDAQMQALAIAVADILAGHGKCTRLPTIYPAIDTLPETLLDILAEDFKVDWWSDALSLPEKRATLAQSWKIHRILGTKAAVEGAIRAAFGGGCVREWFDYDGEPYHYRIEDIPISSMARGWDGFTAMLRVVQRRSAVLDCVVVDVDAVQRLYTGLAMMLAHCKYIACAAVDVDNLYPDGVIYCDGDDFLLDDTGAVLVGGLI